MKKACQSYPARPVASQLIAILLAACLLPTALRAADTSAPVSGAKPTKSKGVYLQTLGPAPLRIMSGDLPSSSTPLPKLALKDTSSEDSASQNPSNEAPPNQPSGPLTAPQPNPIPAEPDYPMYGPPSLDSLGQTGPPGNAAVMPSQDGIVTPQMLVQYFKPVGSNYLGGAWSVPVFVPPTPPAPSRPSTATYRSQ